MHALLEELQWYAALSLTVLRLHALTCAAPLPGILTGQVDFDRSVVGPYCWDLVRMLVSLSLRQKHMVGEGKLLHSYVITRLRAGYLRGLRRPDLPVIPMSRLNEIPAANFEKSVRQYIKEGKAWAK